MPAGAGPSFPGVVDRAPTVVTLFPRQLVGLVVIWFPPLAGSWRQLRWCQLRSGGPGRHRLTELTGQPVIPPRVWAAKLIDRQFRQPPSSSAASPIRFQTAPTSVCCVSKPLSCNTFVKALWVPGSSPSLSHQSRQAS